MTIVPPGFTREYILRSPRMGSSRCISKSRANTRSNGPLAICSKLSTPPSTNEHCRWPLLSRKRFRAQFTVEVDPHNPAGPPHTLSHQTHNFARPTPNVQTPHAKAQANPVQH